MTLKPGIYGGTVIPQDREGYAVVNPWPRAGRHLIESKWYAVRYRDCRVMASGGVTDCLRWVNVWGPMYGG
jgi:hypothetical protein